jgi:hypothetical protein
MSVLWIDITTKSRKKLMQVNDVKGQFVSMDNQVNRALDGLQKPVVVALIDDGVGNCDPDFSQRVIEGVSFDYQGDTVGALLYLRQGVWH